MNKSALLLSSIAILFSCSHAAPVYKDPSAPVERRVEDLLRRMTLKEKLLQLSQYYYGGRDNDNNIPRQFGEDVATAGSVIYYEGDNDASNEIQSHALNDTRLGIPVLFGFDVIHGFRTCFPIPLAQAASFDPSLTMSVSRAAAFEASACGIRWTFSPMVDIARDPRWGRIAEGYGEDPYLTSRFAEAAVRGYQGDSPDDPRSMAACVKHFVGYGASEAGRDYVYTEISRQTLWDTYLPPFKAAVDAGCQTVMSAFNDISGIPATVNRYTLTEIMKERWGLGGFIVSDWQAVAQLVRQGAAEDEGKAAEMAFKAGIDMDMTDNLYVEHFPELIEKGRISRKELDDAVRRILRFKFRLGLFEHPFPVEGSSEPYMLLPETVELARKSAASTFVLLKNESSLLPLPKGLNILITGPLAADHQEVLGSWKARARAEESVSILDALRREDVKVIHSPGCNFEEADAGAMRVAVSASAGADVIICCLGEKARWSGENASRSDIALPEVQTRLLAALKKTGKPVVVILSNGRPLDLRPVEPFCDALLEIWQPGTQTGPAVADVLSGRVNPSGKLPVTFPCGTGQIPIYYGRRNPARGGDMGRFQDVQEEPFYPFGYGLSYSSFVYSSVRMEGMRASVTVTNESAVDGEETVLWFMTDKVASVTRPCRELKYFEKKMIHAGESMEFHWDIDPERDLSFPDERGSRRLEKGEFLISAGLHGDAVPFIL